MLELLNLSEPLQGQIRIDSGHLRLAPAATTALLEHLCSRCCNYQSYVGEIVPEAFEGTIVPKAVEGTIDSKVFKGTIVISFQLVLFSFYET